MANLYGKNCNPDILNPEQERKLYADGVTTLKRDHIFIGNESAEAIQAFLDPLFFELTPRTSNSPKLSLKEIDHGTLSGLSDDDHEQYVHVSIDREISANHTFTGNLTFSGLSYFLAGIQDIERRLGNNFEILSSIGGGRPIWRSTNDLTIDHRFLTNLDSDDHLQYVHISENREISADHLFTGDIEVSGSVEISGSLKDSESNLPTKGQIPIADEIGKFQWRTPVIENVFYVTKNGNDNNDGLTFYTAKSTINGALDALRSGFLGDLLKASDQILMNKKFLIEETIDKIFVNYPDFIFPSSGSGFELYSNAKKLIEQNKTEIADRAIGDVVYTYPNFIFPGDTQPTAENRYRDSYRLVRANKQEIIDETWDQFLIGYPTFAAFEQDYRTLLDLFVESINLDLLLLSNNYSINFLKRIYSSNDTLIFNNLEQTDYIFTECGSFIKKAINNLLTIKDLTITPDPGIGSNEDDNSCSNIKTNIDNLVSIVRTYISLGNISSLPLITRTSTLLESKCYRDILYVIRAVYTDIYYDGNFNIIDSATKYFNSASLSGEVTQSITAFEGIANYAKLAINNNLYFVDETLSLDPSTEDIENDIDSLIQILVISLQNGNLDSLPETDRGEFYLGTQFCKRDLGLIIDAIATDLKAGGNINSVEAGEAYYSSGSLDSYIENEIDQTIFSLTALKQLMFYAIDNWVVEDTGLNYVPLSTLESPYTETGLIIDSGVKTSISNYVDFIINTLQNGKNTVEKQIPTYKTVILVSSGVYYEPNPINLPPNTTVKGDNLRSTTVIPQEIQKDLFYVSSGTLIEGITFRGHESPAAAVSYAQKNGVGITGVIKRGPYIKDVTSYTTTGTGMRVDGNLAGGFKTMNLDSYTQINQGGIGIEILNNSYAQLVSLFTICCDIGVYCHDGGSCDLTNSCSSFGDIALLAEGVSALEFEGNIEFEVEPDANLIDVKNIGSYKPYQGQVVYFDRLYYQLDEIRLVNPGRGYLKPPRIEFSNATGPSGVDARARARVRRGKVIDVFVVRSGRSYETRPTFTVSPPDDPNEPNPVTAEFEIKTSPIYYSVNRVTDIENQRATLEVTPQVPYTLPVDTNVKFFRQSRILASGISFQYTGATTDLTQASPSKDSQTVTENETESRDGGLVVFTSTDQNGNFKIGDGVIIDQAAGVIGGNSFSRGLFAQITPIILALQ